MKKLSVILAVLLALTMLPAVGASAEGQNLIQNGDFELIDDSGFATGWTRSNVTSISVKTATGADGNTDNKVVAFVKPEARQNIKFTTDVVNYPVDPATEYVLSFDAYRTAGASKFNVTIQYRNADGDKIKDADDKDVYWEQTSQEALKDAWKHFDFAVTDIPEETRIFEITFQNSQNVSASTNAAELYFDNISIDEKEVITNLVSNGDFETVGGDGFATGWERTTSEGEAITTITVETFAGASGDAANKCVVFGAGVNKADRIKYSVFGEIDNSKDYALTLNATKTQGTPNFNIVVDYRDETGAKIKVDGTAVSESFSSNSATKDAWGSHIFLLSKMPEGTCQIDLTIAIGKAIAADATHRLYIDDVSVHVLKSEVTYSEDKDAGTIAVSYNAYLPTSYEGEDPSIVAVAALYKTDGGVKSLVSVSISDATPLTKGAPTTIDLGSFDMPETDADKYSIRVFSYKSIASFEKFDTFPAKALVVPVA